MPARALSFACLAVALLGLAAGLYKLRVPPGPVGEEATQTLMAASLWHDRDLTFDHRDLLRSYHFWDHGPAGLALTSPDGGRSMHFGEPFLYALAALPFYGLLGAQGLLVLNMALFLAVFAAAWAYWRRESAAAAPAWTAGSGASATPALGLLLGGALFASASFAYVFRLEPEVFAMAGGFLPLVAWLRLRRLPALSSRQLGLLAGSGALLAAAAVTRPQVALLALPILIDLLASRRWAGLAAFLAGAFLCLAGTAAVERRLVGYWPWAAAGERRIFHDELPIESQHDLWAPPGTTGVEKEPARPPLAVGLRLLPRNAFYWVMGRHAGLLPYFPFVFFSLVLFLAGPRERGHDLLAAALLAAGLLLLLRDPGDWHGGAEAFGNRRFAVLYPAFLLLPGRLPGRSAVWRLLVVPFAVAGLWTLPALAESLLVRAPDAHAAVHVRAAPFRALPLELTLLHRLPGRAFRAWGDAVWVVPRESFSTEEGHPNGVWVLGATTSEVIVAAPRPLESLSFRAWSLSADNELTLASGVETVRVRFDTEGKRGGTPLTLAVRPAARDLGFPPGGPEMSFYHFTLTTTDGIVPARRMPDNRDPRYLGVFLDFTGKGP